MFFLKLQSFKVFLETLEFGTPKLEFGTSKLQSSRFGTSKPKKVAGSIPPGSAPDPARFGSNLLAVPEFSFASCSCREGGGLPKKTLNPKSFRSGWPGRAKPARCV